MKHKNEKMCYFPKAGDRMSSTEINCLRQHMKIHVLKPNLLKPKLTFTVIQELWFLFLCINPSSEQPWFFFHLIKGQNSNWLKSIGAVLGNGQVSPVPTEHDKPQWRGGPGRSWDVWQGCIGWRKDTGGCSWAWAHGQAPSWAVQTRRLKATHAPSNKVLVIRTSIVLPAASFTHYLSLILRHPYNNFISTLPNYLLILSPNLLPSDSPLNPPLPSPKKCQRYGFVPFKYLSKSL